jgi:hypothetical protein
MFLYKTTAYFGFTFAFMIVSIAMLGYGASGTAWQSPRA